MAVEDKYVDPNSNLASNKLANGAYIQGADTLTLVNTFEVAAADDDGSVYRVGKGLSANLIPIKIEINSDAITSSTDWDLGLYNTETGTVVSKDCFVNGLDISSGLANGSESNGLAAVAIDSLHDRLFEHGGHTTANKKEGYDLCFTANTVGSAAGTVTIRATFAQG